MESKKSPLSYVESVSDDESSRSISPIEEKEQESLLQQDNSTLEAQQTIQQDAPVEYTVSSTRKLVCLSLYFLLNLGMTLSNKAVMQTAKYPWTLTTIHAATTSIGCAGLLQARWFELSRLNRKEHLILVAFSTLFTINIALSNVSLALVSVPFHQVARSLCPAATILIYRFVYARTYSKQTYLSMLPLILGVGLTTYGDYNFTLAGFILTFLGVLLSAIKAVASNRLMTGSLKLSALEILFRMSPLAALQCLVYAWSSGELTKIGSSIGEGELMTKGFLIMMAGNAATAFLLNVASFETNKVAGALTISVCSNVKQSLTILLGVVLFSVKVSLLNGVGMLITMLGAAWYSKVELDSKRAKALQQGKN